MDSAKEKLTAERKKCEAELKAASHDLTELRKAAAKELEGKILAELAELNFKDAQLIIEFKESREYTDNGTDLVEFLISTNKGEKLKPLSKIASGGEMSRIMLAFKKIVGDYDEIPTMIFDEIDTGISGITASIVGKKLKQIAENHQILCITHLPQIAAFGDHNYKIYKESDDTSTYTTVVPPVSYTHLDVYKRQGHTRRAPLYRKSVFFQQIHQNRGRLKFLHGKFRRIPNLMFRLIKRSRMFFIPFHEKVLDLL